VKAVNEDSETTRGLNINMALCFDRLKEVLTTACSDFLGLLFQHRHAMGKALKHSNEYFFLRSLIGVHLHGEFESREQRC